MRTSSLECAPGRVTDDPHTRRLSKDDTRQITRRLTRETKCRSTALVAATIVSCYLKNGCFPCVRVLHERPEMKKHSYRNLSRALNSLEGLKLLKSYDTSYGFRTRESTVMVSLKGMDIINNTLFHMGLPPVKLTLGHLREKVPQEPVMGLNFHLDM